MKKINLILIVFLLLLPNNMLAKSSVYSKNAWKIQSIREFEDNYKKQENNVFFLLSMLEQDGLEVYKADVGIDNTNTQLTGNPMIQCVYLYPNLAEIQAGDSYYRLKLIVNKYPFYMDDIIDLVYTEEPPYDDVSCAIAGLICSSFVFEEMVKGEEADDIEWNTLYVWKLKKDLTDLMANKTQPVKVSEIYSILEKYKLLINDVNEYSTSPWVDSEGRSYLRSLYLYSRAFKDMRKADKCYSIQIVLDYSGKEVDKDKFWAGFPDKNYVPIFTYKTKDYYVKDVIITVDSKL